MSILVDGSASSASALSFAGAPAATNNITVMFWYYFAVDMNTFTSFWWGGRNSASAPYQAIYIGTGADGTQVEIWNDGTRVDSGTYALTTGRWYHFAMVTQLSPSAAFTCWIWDETAATTTTKTGNWTASSPMWSAQIMWFGNDPFTETANGWYADIKVLDGVQLTQDQVIEERFVGRSTNRVDLLWQWCPCLGVESTTTLDWSSNARPLTRAGTTSVQNHAPSRFARKGRWVGLPSVAADTLHPAIWL